MRDRMVDLLCNSGLTADTETFEELADHLIENGVICPPCKVGDVVYSFGYDWQKAKDVVTPYQITNITITQNKKGVWTKKYRAMRVLNGKTIDCQLNFEFDTIGKTVFLTKEEAEEHIQKGIN